MSEIEIRSDASASDWDAFVNAAEAGTCFHLYGWKKPLQEVLGYELHYFSAHRDGRIVGVLPVALVRSSLFGCSVTSLPFCSYGGPLASDESVEQALIRKAESLAREGKAKYFEMRRLGREARDSSSIDLYCTFRKTLPVKEEDWSFIPSKRRNMVRKGIKDGLTAEVMADTKAFFHLYAENARAHGTPALPQRFFEVLVQSLGNAVDILFVKNSSGVPISAIMSFYFRGEVHAGFAGELPEARHAAANDFKYWQLVQHAVRRGCTLFDFGRSKKGTGSFDFKRLWGFEPTQISHDFILIGEDRPPELNPTNKKFSLAITVWKKLPRAIVDIVGPRIIHGLG